LVLTNDLAAETVRALAAEAAIQADVDANEADADAAISAEETRALAAEAAIQADVDQNEADSDAAIQAEETRAMAAELVLTNDLATEEARALAAELVLQGNIDVETGRIDALLAGSDIDLNTLLELVTAYELADTSIVASIVALQADVDQNEADSDAAIAAENVRALAAEAALQVALDAGDLAEETRALAAEAAIQADVDQNEADSDAAIAAEQARAEAAELVLTNGLAAEEARALAAEGVIQADVDSNEAASLADRSLLRADLALLESRHQTDIIPVVTQNMGSGAQVNLLHNAQYTPDVIVNGLSMREGDDFSAVTGPGGIMAVSFLHPLYIGDAITIRYVKVVSLS
jgi:hypothetical protein